jgi:hypothetical protein
MSDHLQDTIEFLMDAEEPVTNNTLKITVNVVGIIQPTMTEAALRQNINEMLDSFISGAKWHFSNLSRTSHASRMEEITVQATTQVAETENHGLDRRREQVSREGLSIQHHRVDMWPPARLIEEAETRLRLAILKKAQQELTAINAAMETTYRIGAVDFTPQIAQAPAPNIVMTTKRRPDGTANLSAPMDPGMALGHTVRLSMRARVVLRRHPPAA